MFGCNLVFLLQFFLMLLSRYNKVHLIIKIAQFIHLIKVCTNYLNFKIIYETLKL